MKKLGMKLVVLLFCCNVAVGGWGPILSVSAVESNSRASESVETWMPDPNLRKAVAYYLGQIDPNDITKEAIADLDMLTFDQYTLDIPEGTVVDFTGLEYAGELLALDSTYIIAENVPTIKVAEDSFVYVMPNVLKKLENSGNVAQLQIGTRYGEGVPASELVGLGEYIHRLNPTNYLRIFSKDMADFSAIGIQSEALTEIWSAEFVTQSQLQLPELRVEQGHTGEVQYKQETLKDFMGNSLLSAATHSAPGMVWFLNENKEEIEYPSVDYTEEGMVFEAIPEEAAYVLVEFMQLPTALSNSINTRALTYATYTLRALVPITRFQPAADVTVRYHDEAGEQIADEEILTGNIGEEYISEQKVIGGYTFKEVQGNPTGPFTAQPQTVTYVYTKNPVQAGDVTVKYQDTEGNPIADEEILTGTIGEEYVSEQKVIDGYTFKEVQGNATGPFTAQPQTVTYVYTKNTAEESSVTVNYQDEAGKPIADTVTLSGKIGEKYTSEQKKIAGYTFKEVRGNAAGTFTPQAQTVTYVYSRSAEKAATVTAKYQDEDGKRISDDVVLTGNAGEDYKTEQKEIAGFTFKEVKGNAAGKFTDQAQEVIYIYKKTSAATGGVTNTGGNSGTTVVHSINTIHGGYGKNLPNTGADTTLSHAMTLAGVTLMFSLGTCLFVLKRRKR
ncbi:MucBP domain-containing protein [Candidatus Enterococcus murrayae]|uniref:MucBP domain-containing protein n=1 Tax=Candidatus Enterococcus murrayae TaxID=2815321 RepID=A0ABS3HEH3_9ENTE|nr:MucBP domain-containing protein [Enterococcus sp. MJM16]MBO0451349.1 MucBP domain-containing protein [Enterococcus sp. MJM16]